MTAAQVGGAMPGWVDTIYFGGGTPSLLSAEQLRAVFQAIHSNVSIAADAEVTLEAAPGQVDDALLEEAQRCGVNRVSLGVQSFVDREARAVGRLHTGAMCLAEIDRLRGAGVPHVSLDLIAGLPYQTPESWTESLQRAVDSGVEHISVYMLETDGESRLGTEVERVRNASQLTVLGESARYHAAAAPSDEQCADLYLQACDALAAHGFAQYEISNFAKVGAASRHNQKYWDRASYLGFGLDAHSMLPCADGVSVRFQNTDSLDTYLAGTGPSDVVQVDALAALEETVFLGLRRNTGITVTELEQWCVPEATARVVGRAQSLTESGFLVEEGGRLQLTPRGRIVSSAVFGELLA